MILISVDINLFIPILNVWPVRWPRVIMEVVLLSPLFFIVAIAIASSSLGLPVAHSESVLLLVCYNTVSFFFDILQDDSIHKLHAMAQQADEFIVLWVPLLLLLSLFPCLFDFSCSLSRILCRHLSPLNFEFLRYSVSEYLYFVLYSSPFLPSSDVATFASLFFSILFSWSLCSCLCLFLIGSYSMSHSDSSGPFLFSYIFLFSRYFLRASASVVLVYIRCRAHVLVFSPCILLMIISLKKIKSNAWQMF